MKSSESQIRVPRSVSTLVENAESLVEATADVANEKVSQARRGLATAVEAACDGYAHLEDTAKDSAKAAKRAIRDHPFQAMAVAAAVGAVLGYCILRRK